MPTYLYKLSRVHTGSIVTHESNSGSVPSCVWARYVHLPGADGALAKQNRNMCRKQTAQANLRAHRG